MKTKPKPPIVCTLILKSGSGLWQCGHSSVHRTPCDKSICLGSTWHSSCCPFLQGKSLPGGFHLAAAGASGICWTFLALHFSHSLLTFQLLHLQKTLKLLENRWVQVLPQLVASPGVWTSPFCTKQLLLGFKDLLPLRMKQCL